ncbi:MAG: MFS transporter, partial [Planctomycetes bacterium]|nr:MFS transporter [Planctomycetota bacterium]
LMFYQLFDILPNFIDDWVDSRSAADALAAVLGSNVVPTVNGGNLPQEWMINLNALLISVFAFAVGYLTGRMRSLRAIIVGIAISAIAIYMLGMSMNGWWILSAIAMFSLGEMMASPTKMRYLAGIAPKGKEGQYMGYVNFTVGIGWSIGSIVAGHLYEQQGDKVVLARRYLVQQEHLPAEQVEAIPKIDLLPFFERTVGVDAWGTRRLLWETYEPYRMWLIFTLIGAASMLAIAAYNWLVTAADRNPEHSLNTRGGQWVRAFLIPICAVLLTATVYYDWPIGLALNAALFCLMLLVSLIGYDVPLTKSGDRT